MKRLLLASVFCLAGCADNPAAEVEESGFMEASLIQVTSTEPLNDASEVLVTVIGQPGAVPNVGAISAENERTGETDSDDVSTSGSFVLQLQALLGDGISLEYSHGGESVGGHVDATAPSNAPLVDAQSIDVTTDDHGNAIVSVLLNSPLAADVQVHVSNHANHEVELLTPHSPTELVGTIPAHSGDTLLVYASRNDEVGQAHAVPVP